MRLKAGKLPLHRADPTGQLVVPVALDFTDPATWTSALDGVTRVFFMRPPAEAKAETFRPFLFAVKAARVEQVVFLSLLGAEKNKVVPHRGIEDLIRQLEIPCTFLRPSFFMQNLSEQHREEIRLQGEILVPAGNGRTSFIDVEDIAAVACKTLTEDGHVGKAYPLTGDEALTYAEVAELLSAELGRPIAYKRPGLVRFLIHHFRIGTPYAYALVMGGIYTTCRLGLAGTLTRDTCELLGRPAITMREFVRKNRAVWLP